MLLQYLMKYLHTPLGNWNLTIKGQILFIYPAPTKKIYLSPILSDRPNLKNVSFVPSVIDSSHLRMENSILLPPTSVTVNTESFVTSQCSKSFGRAKQKKNTS